MKLRSALLPLAALLLPVLVAGCGPQPVVAYEDLVTDRADPGAGEGGGDPRAQLYCADETHWVRPLVGGEEISLPVDFGAEPRLVLTWCRQSADRGELDVRVTADGAGPVEGRVAVGGIPRWQRWELDLAPLAGRHGRVTVGATLDGDGRVLLRDAYVVHRTAEAAGWPRRGVHVEAEEAAGRAPQGAAEPASPTAVAAPSADGPRILLVSVDTLRADLVGAVAALPPSSSPTPHLDALAAEGEVFVPHYAAASWTKPSHAALLTGYPGPVHGAITVQAMMTPAVPTLAERLRAAGLATGGLVHDCVWLNPKFGFHRGFDDYRSVKWRSGQLGRAAVNWMAAHRDRPFFFFLHTFDAHSDFLHLPYEGAGVNTASVRRRFAVEKYGCRQGHCASALLEALPLGDVEPLPQEPRILRYLYAAGVRETDLHLGRLFADLRRLGLWDQLTVVVTSDHGEMLLEHGRTLHGQWYEEVLKVPLIVKWPHGERAGTRTAIPTSALDVVPTLLAAAGLEADELPGFDLRRPRRGRTLFTHHSTWQVAIRGDLKGVFTRQGGRYLFDLAADPAEEHDLASRRPEVVDGLGGDLDALAHWSAATRARLGAEDEGIQDLSDEERQRLRALGYLR